MQGLSLPGMAAALRALLGHLGLEPVAAIGHSAGAAVACRMALSGELAVRKIISLNGALLPPLHMPLQVFSPLARLLAATPLIPAVFAMRARNSAAVSRLIAGTGSRLDADGLNFYQSLLCNPRHVSAALRMMAVWDLAGLARELGALRTPLDLIVAEGDRTIAPAEALRVQCMLPAARVFRLAGLGHLAHEEDPVATLPLLIRCLAGTGADGRPASAPADSPASAAPSHYNSPEGATSGRPPA
jgi:magnesium chelatase accessory protein